MLAQKYPFDECPSSSRKTRCDFLGTSWALGLKICNNYWYNEVDKYVFVEEMTP